MSSEEKLRLPTHNEGKVRLVLCKYRQKGCNVKLTKERMSEHERSCPFINATTQTDDTSLHRQLQEISDSNVGLSFRDGVLEYFVFEHITRLYPRALPMSMIADQIQDGVHGMGVNIMEICNFAEKKRQVMANRHLALISDPFNTPNCVKMKLKVFLNGEEVEGDICMTVYIVLVRSLEDDSLNWPFMGKFTLHVFDPESSNYKFVDSFDADPSHFSFQKPCTERNIGYGFLRSIRHSELERLVKDDTLVINVTITAV